MRRNQLIDSLVKVQEAASATDLESIFTAVRTKPGDQRALDSATGLETYAKFIQAYSSFNRVEREILTAFNLDLLKDVSFWSRLMEKGSDEVGLMYSVHTNILALENSVSKFVPLLARGSDILPTSIDGVSTEGTTKKLELKSLTLIIKEDKDIDLSIVNLIDILNSVRTIFDVVSRAYAIESTDIFIGSIDSGSDKSIDIVGIAEAVNKASAFILESWDRIRFRREQKLEKSFKSMTDGLSLIEKIQSSVDHNALSPEEAEKMKRNVLKSMDALVGNGVYTPEAEARSINKPSEIPVERRLMITFEEPSRAVNAPADREKALIKPVRKPRARPKKST